MENKTTEQFIKEAKEIHGDKYDYSLVDYKNSNTKIKILCNKCKNIFEITPHNHLNGQNCPKCCRDHLKKTTEQFIKEAKKVHGDKYDYSLVDYKNNNTKIKIICHIHGIFEQLPRLHVNGKAECPTCKYIYSSKCHAEKYKKTAEQFIKEAKKVHGNKYDYSKINYINSFTKIKIICPNHGAFFQSPHTHLQGCGCPICKESKGEKKIRTWLENNGKVLEKDFFKEFKFDNCKDTKLLPFDFFIPSKKLLIEYQGEQHYHNSFNNDLHKWHTYKHHDWLKRKYAKDHGFKLLTIPYWNYNNINEILEENL